MLENLSSHIWKPLCGGVMDQVVCEVITRCAFSKTSAPLSSQRMNPCSFHEGVKVLRRRVLASVTGWRQPINRQGDRQLRGRTESSELRRQSVCGPNECAHSTLITLEQALTYARSSEKKGRTAEKCQGGKWPVHKAEKSRTVGGLQKGK